MSQETNFDCIAWWTALEVEGKDRFTISEEGKLQFLNGKEGKEKHVADINEVNAEATIAQLQDKFAQMQTRANELGAEWAAAEDKLKLSEKLAHLAQQLRNTPALGNVEPLLQSLAPAEKIVEEYHAKNHAERVALTQKAESLAESTDWKETTATFKEIIDAWKLTGPSDKIEADKLWNKIDAARNTFYERKRKHLEDQEKDLLQNLDLKMDLVEQAESLVNSNEWKKTSEAFHRLTNEWKTIGHTLNKKNEELWQRFIEAKKVFFDRKREHSERIAKEQDENYTVKLVLVEKAEALRDSRDWNKTAQEFAALMEEWKKTGRVGGERGDELWNRFTAAQEQFFSAKKSHTEEQKQIHTRNYELKMELLRRAEQIKNSNHWTDTTNEMNELLDEWKKIGPVAREISNKIWDEFIAARKHFFNRKDSSREQRKQQHEMLKTIRVEQAREAVAKLLRDITEEEEKIVDFKAALENITPGKKADELKKHLEKLLVESEQKIRRMKEKYAAIQDEYTPKTETATAGANENDSTAE